MTELDKKNKNYTYTFIWYDTFIISQTLIISARKCVQ